MSFLKKIKASRAILYLMRGKDRGKACWHFVLVDKNKYEMFKARIKTNSIELKDYGRVIESGWGQKPPEELTARLKAQYS